MSGYGTWGGYGRVVRDPDCRRTQNDTPVANFSIPADTGWGDNKKTTWRKVVCWGKLAEFVKEKICEGMVVWVQGPEEVREWTDAENRPRYDLEVTANELKVIVWPPKDGKPDVPGFDTAPMDEGDDLPF